MENIKYFIFDTGILTTPDVFQPFSLSLFSSVLLIAA